MVWIAKNKVAKITCTYFGDKSQKICTRRKKKLYGITNYLLGKKIVHKFYITCNMVDKFMDMPMMKISCLSLCCMLTFRVTRGSQNTLFHLLQFDGVEGVFVSPTPQALAATQGHLHSQVLTNFYKCCLQIHTSFHNNHTQNVSPTF